nr:AbrB family transcriptional regulator [Desulfitobacterium hafniense]
MKAKPIYKIMDGKGRVLIPKELRTATGMDYGDIVKVSFSQG